MAGMGGGKPVRNWSGPIWGAGGVVLGSLLTWGGPRAMHRFGGGSSTAKAKAVKAPPTLVPNNDLELTAQPPKGILLSTTGTVKLLVPSETKRTVPQANGVFTGFKNWGATASYLRTGQGGLFLADAAKKQVATGWQDSDFDKFVRGMPLRVTLTPNKPYTLFFQRRGKPAVSLGTVSIVPGAASKPAAKPAAAPAGTPASAAHPVAGAAKSH